MIVRNVRLTKFTFVNTSYINDEMIKLDDFHGTRNIQFNYAQVPKSV